MGKSRNLRVASVRKRNDLKYVYSLDPPHSADIENQEWNGLTTEAAGRVENIVDGGGRARADTTGRAEERAQAPMHISQGIRGKAPS